MNNSKPAIKGPIKRRPLGYSLDMFKNHLVLMFLLINVCTLNYRSALELIVNDHKTLQAAAAFMPPLWLPTFVTDVHHVSKVGPATVVLVTIH